MVSKNIIICSTLLLKTWDFHPVELARITKIYKYPGQVCVETVNFYTLMSYTNS